MEKMLKLIKLLLLVKNKFKLLLVSSIVTISGCASAPKFPKDIKVWETAYAEGMWFCGEYAVNEPRSAKDIKFTPIKDHNISECMGVFGFKGQDFPRVLDYIEALEKHYKDKLKECK